MDEVHHYHNHHRHHEKPHSPPHLERRTICFSQPGARDVLQHGSPGFLPEISRHYAPSESDAVEKLVNLKQRLRHLPTSDFWSALTEGMSALLGAEMTFVFKRVLMDEQNAAVEMPPLGQPGSCMMAAAFYYSNTVSGEMKDQLKGFKFHAYGCPCAYMRHDKVFLIPERLNEFITANPNQLPEPAEAYMAVPLFAEGKCFAHFGAMWSKEGLAQLPLSWAFVEMLLHSLEDQVLYRFLEGSELTATAPDATMKTTRAPSVDKVRVIPHEAVTAAQSLRPYAGSLSHELRTPMQGVVGMLDVMYATVQEAIDGQMNSEVRRVFEALKDNIEVVQDSSRRAVEAADNVVHAYDMDMSVPEKPNLPMDDSNDATSPFSPVGLGAVAAAELRPEILVKGSGLPMARPQKRRRDEAFPNRLSSVHKMPKRENSGSEAFGVPQLQPAFEHAIEETGQIRRTVEASMGNGSASEGETFSPNIGRAVAPGLRHADIRDILQYVIGEGLKMGGRPDSACAFETDFGERVEVRTRGSDGTATYKMIEWMVDPTVPETMFIDEKDLGKLVSCVFLNAIKFADDADGRVMLRVKMTHKSRYITLKISDNGPGIPPAFLPKLFKPFSQQNGSLTRSSEGLGLGLMVAKGIARKLGGDLICSRADTTGPNHGCEFEIKIPLIAGETISRPSSPFGSPVPRRANLHTSESFHAPTIPPAPTDPTRVDKALNTVADDSLLDCFSLDTKAAAAAAHSSPLRPHHRAHPPSHLRDHSPSSPHSDSSTTTTATTTTTHPHHSHTNPHPHPRRKRRTADPLTHPLDRQLATKHPLNILVAEDNKINRRLLVNMLGKFGYKRVYEAHDGVEAVRQVLELDLKRPKSERTDLVLMDLWMPRCDGYEAAEKILAVGRQVGDGDGDGHGDRRVRPTVLAVTADVTDGALERAAQVGMKGFMTKPYKLVDLQRLLLETCARLAAEAAGREMRGAEVGV